MSSDSGRVPGGSEWAFSQVSSESRGVRYHRYGRYNRWLHGFAVVVMVATFVLLIAGGNVTSRGAGLSVPDWPLSFHRLNPPGGTSNFDGTQPGVRDEHGHRLIGACVGLLVVILAAWLLAREPRRWVKWLGVAAFLAVVVQGVLGGLRVTERSVGLAVLHGCLAQAFFCLTVALAVVTSRQWHADVDRGLGQAEYRGGTATQSQNIGLWWAAIACFGVIYLQLVLGVILRQMQTSWIPHFGWAVVVGLAIMTLVRFVFQHPDARQALSQGVIVLLVLYGVQLVLGLATLIVVQSAWSHGVREPQTVVQAILPTVHLAIGALTLGTAAHIAIRAVGITQSPEGVPQ